MLLPADALHAPEKVTAAPGTSNLPPATLCLGREDELAQLRHILASQHEGAITQSGAVHGLGGIGKSALALHYSHRYRHDYTLIWWINAATPDEIEASLAGLTHRLAPHWATTAGQGAQVAWAVQWLAWHPGWLLVYDNVEDPDDLAPYIGALHQGHHLTTSRRTTGWPDAAPILTLGSLDPTDATNLLCRLVFKDAIPTARQQAEARALATDLGHFPLAINQAGAYLAQNRGISLDSYRRRLTTKLGKAAHGVAAERTIAHIWNVTLHTLQQADPLAVDVLHTAAWLAPNEIPYDLLIPPGTDPDDFAEAVGTLAAYSMVADTGTTLSVHRLVQTVLRAAALNKQGSAPSGLLDAERGIERLLYPDDPNTPAPPQQWRHIIPHVIAITASTPPGHTTEQTPTVYSPVSNYLHDQGQTARAIPIFEHVHSQTKNALGEAHPDTLISYINLASAHSSAGNLKKAISMFEAALVRHEQILGDAHPHTLSNRNNLASAYAAIGDYKRAIPLFERNLEQRIEVLGETHLDTLTSRNNLAYGHEVAGELSRAIFMYEMNLAKYRQIFGEDHAKTLYSRNNLSHAYEQAGHFRQALSGYEITLAKRVEVLGDTHPDTLQSRNNLARAYQRTGNLERAISLFEATLMQRLEILGENHPDTLISQNNLALARGEAGEFDQEIILLERTLAQQEQILGDVHPETLTTRSNLALAYQNAGNLDRAIPLHEMALDQRVQTLGDTHPQSLNSRYNLAGAYLGAGDSERAISLHEICLAQHEEILGDTHPDTLNSRHSLAYAYHTAGNFSRAIPLYESALAHRIEVLGDAHPHTLHNRHTLAECYYAAGNLMRAIPMFKAVLTQCEEILGEAHPRTLVSRHNLAAGYMSAGNPGRAIPLYELTVSQCEQALGDDHPQTILSRKHLARARRERQSRF
ncbi:FxSxx-COOH system tetratricopeptide repeat protein [Streptomyces mirabilis]|uniref:FxSxx-COOH system tetratricopeptide repeat protein n=1 Tax=Streptomyces mirabilis TaxID=68239 RepID=UPI00369E1BC9